MHRMSTIAVIVYVMNAGDSRLPVTLADVVCLEASAVESTLFRVQQTVHWGKR